MASSEQRGEEQPGANLGLALAGGAPQGAIYEIGALKALDEALEGVELNQLGVYVGVSAGGFLTSCLANGLTTNQMVRAIVKHEPGEHPFVPETFFKPAVGELGRRLGRTPKLLLAALKEYLTGRERLIDALTVLGRGLPVGIFDNRPIERYVRDIFSIKGRTNSFRDLERKLIVVATDLESGEEVLFGSEDWQHVPISTAVQATTALPGLYPPVEIDGRFYVDGILRKTMHASVALGAGARLVFAINPIVPVDTRKAVEAELVEAGKVVDQGLATVLSQTIRTLIHSRMTLGIEAYKTQFPDADVVLLEPRRDDHESFFSNIFSFSSRLKVCERAYQATRQALLDRRQEIEPMLEKHGVSVRWSILEDQERDLWAVVGLDETPKSAARSREAQGPKTELLSDLGAALDRLENIVGASQPS